MLSSLVKLLLAQFRHVLGSTLLLSKEFLLLSRGVDRDVVHIGVLVRGETSKLVRNKIVHFLFLNWCLTVRLRVFKIWNDLLWFSYRTKIAIFIKRSRLNISFLSNCFVDKLWSVLNFLWSILILILNNSRNFLSRGRWFSFSVIRFV